MSGLSCLVFETSTPCASLALITADGTVHQQEFASDRNHNALLFGPLEELLAHPAADEIGWVLVGSGPGSYSGTRVGIAAAQGVAIARGCPAISVPSILAVPSARSRPVSLAVGDARRGSYWTAAIENETLPDSPILTDLAGLESALQRASEAGYPVFSLESSARWPLTADRLAQIHVERPDATRLWEAWQAASAVTQEIWQASPPQPIYLKPPHITPAKSFNPRLNPAAAKQ